jgi:paraquat-inducible protein B
MSNKIAKVSKIKLLSPIWIVPIITAIVGIWILYTHIAGQGKSFTLTSADASGIIAGKTVIRSRNVDVGIIEKVTLSDDFKRVILKGRLKPEMSELLQGDSIFWIVKPQIGREGVSGLGTLFSGVYIELMQGTQNKTESHHVYELLDTPPMASINTEGIRLNLVGDQTAIVSQGAPVMFRGYRVGNVEKAEFDVQNKNMKYQIFIAKPYQSLVTRNIRFWRDVGINLDLSARGANLTLPSFDTLLDGGINFDVPDGATFGPVENQAELTKITYQLYADKKSIQDSQYTVYDEFLLMFSDSITGLTAGSSVEYHGIRLGTVSHVPYFQPNMQFISSNQYTIPVLIRIEPERLPQLLAEKIDISKKIIEEQANGLRAAIKSANILTGAMYIDLDFYPEEKQANLHLPSEVYGFKTIATVPAGLSQIQAKLVQTLDNFNKLPFDKTIDELNRSIAALNQLLASKDMQALPKEMRESLQTLDKTLRSVQPGSDLNRSFKTDLDKFDRLLDEFTPLLKTLNDKSNALIFSAPAKHDPQPKAKGNK